MDFEMTLAPMTTTEQILLNFTNSTSTMGGNPSRSKMFSLVIKVVYAIGIIGNAAAIVVLRRGERRIRNRKHLLLLTTLAANDLVALMGMMCAMLVAEHVGGARDARWYCGVRVALRVFGIGSVCIAVTMALERYLALTRPFFYQKQVTYYVIRIALLVSWFWAAILTCAPMLGLGLYYNETAHVCVRYREAESYTAAFAYAVFYVIFGTFLCMVLVYCNYAVTRALYAITAPRNGEQPVRRVSKSSCRQRQRSINGDLAMHHNAATAEEVAFTRLMIILSIFFMMCWLPQMATSALYLGLKPESWKRLNMLSNLSDVLMLFNYVLDPVLYVFMRQRRSYSVSALCHSIAYCFKRGHQTSTESMSCCPQDTQVISDGASAELRPLRPPPALVRILD